MIIIIVIINRDKMGIKATIIVTISDHSRDIMSVIIIVSIRRKGAFFIQEIIRGGRV